jgi:hypothetical protein
MRKKANKRRQARKEKIEDIKWAAEIGVQAIEIIFGTLIMIGALTWGLIEMNIIK